MKSCSRLPDAVAVIVLMLLIGFSARAQTPKLVMDIATKYSDRLSIGRMLPYNGKLLFSAKVDDSDGFEPWVSDGTASGTFRLADIAAGGSNGTENSNPDIANGTLYNGRIYFTAWDSVAGRELWSTDGTVSGTTRFMDLNPGTGSAFDENAADPYVRAVCGGLLYFTADDGSLGRELWATDGTIAGTRLVRDLTSWGSSHPADFCVMQDVLYFTILNGRTKELWRTAGTLVSTIHVATITGELNKITTDGKDLVMVTGSSLGFSDGNPGPIRFPTSYLVFDTGILFGADGLIYFSGAPYPGGSSSGYRAQLCRTDKSASGTSVVKMISPTFYSSPRHFARYGQEFVFTADDGVNGRELWISDGTTANTRMVRDINTSMRGSAFEDSSGAPVVYKNQLYFTATDGSGRYLWSSDGTAAGTYELMPHLPVGGASMVMKNSNLTVRDTSLFFHANYDRKGMEIYRLDTACGPAYASFSYAPESNAVRFTFTGSAVYDSLIWDFGDGSQVRAKRPYHYFAGSGMRKVCVRQFSSCGERTACQDIFAVGLGVSGNTAGPVFHAWPNPASSQLRMETRQPGVCTVFATDGRRIRTWSLQAGNSEADVSFLPAGLYFLEFRADDVTRQVLPFRKE